MEKEARSKKRKMQNLNGETSQVFKRRKEGIKKKAEELAILCDIPVCLVIQSPNGDSEFWPANPDQTRTLLDKYKQTCNKSIAKIISVSPAESSTGKPSQKTGENDAKKNRNDDDNLVNNLSGEKCYAEFPGDSRSRENLGRIARNDSPIKFEPQKKPGSSHKNHCPRIGEEKRKIFTKNREKCNEPQSKNLTRTSSIYPENVNRETGEKIVKIFNVRLTPGVKEKATDDDNLVRGLSGKKGSAEFPGENLGGVANGSSCLDGTKESAEDGRCLRNAQKYYIPDLND